MTAFQRVVELPYAFDTRAPIVVVLKGTLGLLAVMVLMGLVMLLVRRDPLGATGTLLFDAGFAAFAWILVHHRPGAEGRITRDAVEVRARRVWGIALPGPVGTFALDRFRAVQAERSVTSATASSGMRALERVTLLGHPGTPDLLVRVAPRDGLGSVGEALAAALGLPVEVVGVGGRAG